MNLWVLSLHPFDIAVVADSVHLLFCCWMHHDHEAAREDVARVSTVIRRRHYYSAAAAARDRDVVHHVSALRMHEQRVHQSDCPIHFLSFDSASTNPVAGCHLVASDGSSMSQTFWIKKQVMVLLM